VNWILGNWRMKLLAIALSIGLFAALAFSENPIQFATVDAKINYVNRPDNLVLLNQPVTTKVTISGLTADVKNATVRADVDLSKIKKGPAFTLTPTARVFGNNVSAQSVQPITFGVDDLNTVQLDIDVRTPNQQQGWSVTKAAAVCGNAAQTCKVAFSGPASLEDGLHAFVSVDAAINVNSFDQLSSTVKFDQNGRVFDPAAQKTFPLIGWNPQTVTAHVEAKQGTYTKRVALVDAFPSAPPPSGYHVTGVTIDPPLIDITGPPDVLSGITRIVLPAVSLGANTSDHSFRVSIPSPDPSVSLSASVANVTYSISKNPAVSPTPTPST
jgi:YbbR domain-containing protein